MHKSEADTIASLITAATGLGVTCAPPTLSDGHKTYLLHPVGHDAAEAFRITLTLGWRSVEAVFTPGKFAGELLSAMGHPKPDGRALFNSVVAAAQSNGVTFEMAVNGSQFRAAADEMWASPWRTLRLRLRRGQMDVNEGNSDTDIRALSDIACQIIAMTLALLPIEQDASASSDLAGFPEGALQKVLVNRYERDRRNRAAAVAIHGVGCACCRTVMRSIYGEVAAGLIEIHHLTPVSVIGPDYVVDPKTDLAPLCPNCHAVAHRRDPPFELAEIRTMLGDNAETAAKAVSNTVDQHVPSRSAV